MQILTFLFSLALLVMSVVIHEVSHGYMANALGDPTARHAGRLTLNPLPHLDLFGSVLLPLLLVLSGLPAFGWALPVPYNPYNLRAGRFGPALVAVAGPLANMIVAIVFAIPLRFPELFPFLPAPFAPIAAQLVLLNLLLFVFNLVPVPPLDGSKVLFAVLPYRFYHVQAFLERYQLIFVFLLVFVLWGSISPVVFFLFRLLTGEM